MLHRIPRSLLSFTLAVAFAGQAVAAPLAYRMAVGDSFELVTTTDAEVPMVGAKHVVAAVACRVEAATTDHLTCKQTITSKIAGKPDYTLSLGCDISPEGRISNFTGINLQDPKMALVARNAGMGLPSLPNEEAPIGHSWQEEKPLFLPNTPIPGMPETVRLVTSYKVTGLGKTNGKDTVTIAMTMQEAEGKLKVRAKGEFVVEAANGKPVSGHIEGEASIRVVIKTFTVPFKVAISTK